MKTKPVLLKNALAIVRYLQGNGIDPLLYGSLGVSLYLGPFKDFNDIDLLIENTWLGERWPELIGVMQGRGFSLVAAREHEFQDQAGLSVAFAEETVLIRDKILDSLNLVITRKVDGTIFRTLSPEGFREAYRFSVKDGYRKDKRGKKDQDVIELLDRYLISTW
ncbi:MAG TPA: hypothetical protein VK674_01900 [Candidatus Limnocylindria bacterium]|nr:hypothetical protein [Candidatus Limnocylindria bacterium]